MVKRYNLEELERGLRETYEERPSDLTDFAAIQDRGAEVQIQIALWYFRELNLETPQSDIIAAYAVLCAGGLVNFIRGTSAETSAMALEIFSTEFNKTLEKILTGDIKEVGKVDIRPEDLGDA